MNDWLATLNATSSLWGDAMVRACWQGGLAILAAWGLCRVLAKMPPAAQSWLWRLVYLKLFVALLCATPIALPLLPAPVLHAGPASSWPTPAGAAHATGGGADDSTAPDRGDIQISFPAESPRALPTAACWLLMVWLLAAGWSLVRVIRAWLGVRHLLATSQQVTDPQLASSLAHLSRQLGVRRVPALKTSGEIRSPSLLGVIRPAILLPASLLQACSPAELRLALAHELAHLKRRDLLWNWLPTLAGVLFFFHPMVWLARRQWRLSQELACDEMAASASRATAADLGRLLLQIALQRDSQRRDSLLTAEVSTSFSLFQRRLSAMKSFSLLARSPLTRRRNMAVAATVCLFVGLGGVVPWQVTARESRSTETNPPAAASTPADTVQHYGRVAVVDIHDLFRHHEGLVQFQAELKGQVKAAQTEIRQQREQIKRLAKKLAGLDGGTSEHEQLTREIAQRRKELAAQAQLAQEGFMRREAEAYNVAYDDVVDAVTRFAKDHGIDVVYRKETEVNRRSARVQAPATPADIGITQSSATKAYSPNRRSGVVQVPATPADTGRIPASAANPAPGLGEVHRYSVNPASAVLKRISRAVVYQREKRWDITGSILDMLNRQ